MNRLAYKKQRNYRVLGSMHENKKYYGSLNVNRITDNKHTGSYLNQISQTK